MIINTSIFHIIGSPCLSLSPLVFPCLPMAPPGYTPWTTQFGLCFFHVCYLIGRGVWYFTRILFGLYFGTQKNKRNTGGPRLMLLLGPGKNPHQPKIALAKFLFYVSSNKIFSPKNRIIQILVIVLKNRSNKIRSNEIHIRQELSVCMQLCT